MKGLTISQPFASLIAGGEKFVENRTWETMYRGPLAIHAGKGTQYLTKKELASYPTGCIVAVADLAACVHCTQEQCSDLTDLEFRAVKRHKHYEGPFGWVLMNVQQLNEPIPCVGAQGLWQVSPTVVSEILSRIRAGEVTPIRRWPAG
jgi:activating signal cointegrator 1